MINQQGNIGDIHYITFVPHSPVLFCLKILKIS